MESYELPVVEGIELGEFGLAVIDSNENVSVTEKTYIEKIILPENSSFNNMKLKEVYAGVHHSIGIDFDGKVWTWGWNYIGQLGSTSAEGDIPVCINNEEGNPLKNVKMEKAVTGSYHSVGVDSNKKIWTWGRNYEGQLGNGENTEYNSNYTPICLSDISTNPLYNIKIEKIYAGDESTVAIDENGKVWVWGSNSNGQLGNNTTVDTNLPICISNIDGHPFNNLKIIDISINYLNMVAIDENGKLWSCGDNAYGQIGDGTTTDTNLPICISNIEGTTIANAKMIKVVKQLHNTVALDSDGNIWNWGLNSYGQFGNGTTIGTKIPECLNATVDCPLYGIKIKSIDAKAAATIIIDENGKLWAWGRDDNGKLAVGGTKIPLCINDIHTNILGNVEFQKVSMGNEITLALDSENELWVWGRGEYLGIASNDYSINTPTKFSSNIVYGFEKIASSMKKIESNSNNIWAIDKNQKIYDVLNGVSISDNVSSIANIKFKDLYMTDSFSFAIDTDGKLWDVTSSSVYCMNDSIPTFANVKVKDVSLMNSYMMLIDTDGKVWSINPSTGEVVCLNDTNSEIANIKFSSLESNSSTYLIDESLNVWEININSETNALEIVCLTDTYDYLTGIKQISVGTNHVLALDSDGNVYMWNGYLNDVLTIEPVKLELDDSVSDISSSYNNTAFLFKSDYISVDYFGYIGPPS